MSSGDQPQYKSRLRTYQSEYDIKNQRFKKVQDQYLKQDRLNKLKAGQLTGVEQLRAERDMAVDLHKETDFQGDIINDIGKDIRGANDNLGQIAIAVDEQGKQINRIHGTVLEGQSTVKQTDRNAQKMIRRAKCTKVLLWLFNILIFLIDIALVVLKAYNHYKCKHK